MLSAAATDSSYSGHNHEFHETSVIQRNTRWASGTRANSRRTAGEMWKSIFGATQIAVR